MITEGWGEGERVDSGCGPLTGFLPSVQTGQRLLRGQQGGGRDGEVWWQWARSGSLALWGLSLLPLPSDNLGKQPLFVQTALASQSQALWSHTAAASTVPAHRRGSGVRYGPLAALSRPACEKHPHECGSDNLQEKNCTSSRTGP